MSKCLKKFEYTRIYCEVDHNELDMMGEAGWELVAIELSKSVGLPTLWFKREKQEVKYENRVLTPTSWPCLATVTGTVVTGSATTSSPSCYCLS